MAERKSERERESDKERSLAHDRGPALEHWKWGLDQRERSWY